MSGGLIWATCCSSRRVGGGLGGVAAASCHSGRVVGGGWVVGGRVEVGDS